MRLDKIKKESSSGCEIYANSLHSVSAKLRQSLRVGIYWRTVSQTKINPYTTTSSK